MNIDKYFMIETIKEAKKAYKIGEIPIGAIIVLEKKIISRAYNKVEKLKNPTAHAEIIALTSACNHMKSKYLKLCTMYVNLEPCIMCSYAIYFSKIFRLVFSIKNKKKKHSIINKNYLYPKIIVNSGILKKENEKLMKSFFKKL